MVPLEHFHRQLLLDMGEPLLEGWEQFHFEGGLGEEISDVGGEFVSDHVGGEVEYLL